MSGKPIPAPPRQLRPAKRFLSIRIKLIALFCAVFLGGVAMIKVIDIFGLPFSSAEGWLAHEKADGLRDVSLVADIVAHDILVELRELERDTNAISGNRLIKDELLTAKAAFDSIQAERKPEEDLRALIEAKAQFVELSEAFSTLKRTHGEYEIIDILDPVGKVIFASTDKERLGAASKASKVFWLAGVSRRSVLGNVEKAPGANVPLIEATTSVRDEDGIVFAIIRIVVNAEKALRPILDVTTRLGDGSEALLVDETGAILTPLKHPLSDGSEATPLDDTLKTLAPRLAADGQEGLVEAVDYRGKEVLAATRHIRINAEWGWGLVVKADKDMLFAHIRRDLERTLLTSLLGVVFIVLLVTWLAHRFTRPIEHLGRAAEALSSGDLGVRTGLDGHDEIGALGNAFDRMAENIQRAHEDVAASEQRLRALIDASPYCIHEIDPDGNLMSMNRSGLEMVGATDEGEIRGLHYVDYIDDADRKHVDTLLRRAIHDGDGSEFEFRSDLGGGPSDFASMFVPLPNAKGPPFVIMGISQDIRACCRIAHLPVDLARAG